MDRSDFVIIGGVACGPKTAATLKRRLPEASVTLFQKEEFMSYASCGMPWLASGDLMGHEALLMTQYGTIRDPEFFEHTKHFKAVTNAEVTAIDRTNKHITVRLKDGKMVDHGYGKLVLATGAVPRALPCPVCDSDRVSHFHALEDAIRFRGFAERGEVSEAVIIGGGLIGLELCEALGAMWGIDQTLIEKEPQLLPYVLDPEMSAIVEKHLRDQGVKVRTSMSVAEIIEKNGRPTVVLGNDHEIETDYVFICVGVDPNATLAYQAGLEIGATGGIAVDEHMQTSDPDIYAGGDCVESVNRLTDARFYIPMGSLANRHGRVIAENLAGNDVTYNGALGAFVVKVFDLNVGTVGISQRVADQHVNETAAVWGTYPDKPDYYPDHKLMTLKMTYNPETEHLLGLQAVGEGDICRRVDVFSSFLQRNTKINNLFSFEHCYSPPFSEALDPLHHLAAQAKAQLNGVRFESPMATHLCKPGTIWLDVREPDEASAAPIPDNGCPDRRVVKIPLHHLADSLDELDKEDAVKIFCARGVRSYQAALVLKNAGFKNISVVGGGLHALTD